MQFWGGMKRHYLYFKSLSTCVLIFCLYGSSLILYLHWQANSIPQLGLGSAVSDGTSCWTKIKMRGWPSVALMAIPQEKQDGGIFLMITRALMVGNWLDWPHVNWCRFFTVPRVKDARLSRWLCLSIFSNSLYHRPAVAAFGIYNTIEFCQWKKRLTT